MKRYRESHPYLHLCLIVATVLIVVYLISHDAEADGFRANETADGGFTDNFSDNTSCELSGFSEIIGEQLTLNQSLWFDDFNRSQLSPWHPYDPGGDLIASTDDGSLRLEVDRLIGTTIGLDRNINLRDLKLDFQLKIEAYGHLGPEIILLDDDQAGLAFYYTKGGKMRIWYDRGSPYPSVSIGALDVNLSTDVWYNGSIEVIRGGHIRFILDGNVLDGDYDTGGSFTKIRLAVVYQGISYFDNINLSTTYFESSARSIPVDLPDGMIWAEYQVSPITPPLTYVFIDIIDANSGEVVPGFHRLTYSGRSMMGIDPNEHASLRIQVTFLTYTFAAPSIDYWSLLWKKGHRDWMDELDDGSSMSIDGPLVLVDGRLSADTIALEDHFDRIGMGDWFISQGNADVREGALWMKCIDSQTTTVERDLATSRTTFRFETSLIYERKDWGDAPIIYFIEDENKYLKAMYDDVDKKVRITWYDHGTTDLLGSQAFVAPVGAWIDISIYYDGQVVSFNFGTVSINAVGMGQLAMSSIHISAYHKMELRYDNMSISVPKQSGSAITDSIALPEHNEWVSLNVSRFVAPGGSVTMSFWDAGTYESINGYENISTNDMDLHGIHPIKHPSIRIRFNITGEYKNTSWVDWFEIRWEQYFDGIRIVKGFDEIRLREDEPSNNLLDMTDYFSADYTDPSDLVYEAVNVSSTSHISPTISDHMLSIHLPTRDWFGTARFRIRCTSIDTTFTTEEIMVVVEPVNDPPVIASIDRMYIFEDELKVIDLDMYVFDVDTPINELVFSTTSVGCTFGGSSMRLLFRDGGGEYRVSFNVSDGESIVDATFDVSVEERNDPPVVGEVPRQYVDEDTLSVVDLTMYVADEDTLKTLLKAGSSHPATSTVAGLRITVLFTKDEGITNYTFWIDDGHTKSYGSFEVEVFGRNDAPTITGIGNHAPPVVIDVVEGAVDMYDVHVEDEDDTDFVIHVTSSWRGASTSDEGALVLSGGQGDLGHHEVTVHATDPSGASGDLEIVINVVNTNDPPEPPLLVSPTNHTRVEAGTSIVFSVDVYDRDQDLGQILAVTWSSDDIGEFHACTSDEELSFGYSGLSPGEHIITVTVNDGELSSSMWFHIIVLEPTDGSNDGNGDGKSSIIGLIVIALAALIASHLVTWIFMKKARGTNGDGEISQPRQGSVKSSIVAVDSMDGDVVRNISDEDRRMLLNELYERHVQGQITDETYHRLSRKYSPPDAVAGFEEGEGGSI